MKRIITFVCALGVVLYLTNLGTYAQGHSAGHSSTVSQTHGPDADHGKSTDHRQDVGHGKDSSDTKDTSIADHIQHDSALNAKVATLLPPNTDLKTACAGFKNQGQFIAALHVSKNLNIPFADLKAKMTGPNAKSLGAAIHDVKTALSTEDAKKEAEKAEKQAKADINTKETKPIS